MKTAYRGSESGMALITTMMVLVLVSALMIGFFAAISADQRASGIDRDQTQSYAAAHAGLEKLTTDLARLFQTDFSPDKNQIGVLVTQAQQPVIPGFKFTAPDGTSGYVIDPTKKDSNGNPAPLNSVQGTMINSGPYQGLRGIITRYDLTATARSAGAETRLRRALQTVQIPVFQFGVFSDTDLTFFGGDTFTEDGRVHTNGNLFLAESASGGVRLELKDRVTAAKEVVRKQLANGYSTTSGVWSGIVRIWKTSTTYRDLATSEGSVTDGPTSAANEPTWTNLSMGQYNGYIRNGKTGAKQLKLPIVSTATGAQAIDLIKRPLPGEDVAKPTFFKERYFAKQETSLRILLSDTAADITGLPTVTGTAPVQLDGDWIGAPPAGYGPVDATHPPMPRSPGPTPSPLPVVGFDPAATRTTAGSTTTTINIDAAWGMPNYYKIPATLTAMVGSPAIAKVVTCTGRTLTTFTGCTPTNVLAYSAGTISGNVNSGWAGAFTAQEDITNWQAGSNTITVSTAAGHYGTANFAPSFMFINGQPAGCTGYTTAPAFTQCTGVTTAPGSGARVSNGALTPTGTGTIGGFIKIEKQDAGGAWSDVTTEILNLGFGAPNQVGTICNDPTPDAVIRIVRLRDNGSTCNYQYAAGGVTPKPLGAWNPTDWWPNVLYDPREGNLRDQNAVTSTTLTLNGVMYYIALDVGNLKRWFAKTIGTTGNLAKNDNGNGYLVYFSDRRNNRNLTNQETGEYGWEDIVNPADSTGAPNGQPDPGEDVNANGVLDVYGKYPSLDGVGYNAGTGKGTVVINSLAPLDDNAGPNTTLTPGQARVNRALLFRRALKLANAGVGNLPPGLTVVSENPVYVQGNYNANGTSTWGTSVPASVISDAITLLSNAWNDSESFRFPNDPTGRPASTTGYRFAAVSGKGLTFPQPSWATSMTPFVGSIFGTDGGVGNFLRYVENWNTAATPILYYKGSIVSLFINRQATGSFKCCNNVYQWAGRQYSFDANFLTPSLLPPGTPSFRDVNTLTFRQLLRPTE